MRRWVPRAVGFLALAVLAALAAADPVAAHVGGLSGSVESGPLPSWLTLGTGGALIGVSFLFTSFMTDHDRIRAVNRLGLSLPASPAVRRAARLAARAAGLVGLALVIATGFFGPQGPLSNLAILLVWSGWWAGYAISTYLLGNTWPAVNPWRTIADLLPSRDRAYPDRLGAWPAVVGLLGLVFVEVVGPLAEDARLLAALVVAYSAVTLAGAVAYGTDVWFGRVDPIARVFGLYGRVAPVGRTDDGIELALPVTRLVDYRVPDRPGETALVVALLWATTFDGLVTTPTWANATRGVVAAGVPPLAVYLLTMAGGFGAFLAVYRLAARWSRRTADSYVAVDYIERWFVPSLLPIAAGYHLAHYLNYVLTLAPPLAAAVTAPFSAGAHPAVLALPEWFGLVELGFVLVGHMLAVWVAHSLAFELFPGVLKPIRSQYPFVVVMIAYTVTSLWIVAQPFTRPPYT